MIEPVVPNLAELRDAIASIRALLSRGAESKDFIPAVRILAASHGKVRAPVFNTGARLYRATRHHIELPKSKENLWFPPAHLAKAGRANWAGRPVFYCAAHQSPALAEIEAGPYNIAVISEWVTQDRLIVQDLGFEERAFARFGVDRQRHPHQLEDVKDASDVELEARRFVSDAFLAEDDAGYALTEAIADVFSAGDDIGGVRYPSLALGGKSDNFALKPEYVRTKMRLEAATYFWLKSASLDGTYDFDPVADLAEVGDGDLLSWRYRDHVSTVPPGAGLEVRVRSGDRQALLVPGPTSIVVAGRLYEVVPGAYLEMTADGPVFKLPDGTVIEGSEVDVPAVHSTAGGTVASNPAALAYAANSRLKQYKTIMAICVRSCEIARTRVSIATAVTLSNLELDRVPWTCQLAKQSAFEFHNATTEPERIAWWTYLCAARESAVPLPMLLIVEGGVETLAAINNRAEAVIDECLPDGYTLAWGRGTSDPTDLISCRALGACIEDATQLLDWITGHPECLEHTQPGNKHYSSMRVWPRPRSPEAPRDPGL